MSEHPIDAKLPRVGDRTQKIDGEVRNSLIGEEDPAVLDAHARVLWQQWQALDGKLPEAVEGYHKTTVEAAVVQLTEQYVEAEAPIPYELSRLVRAIIAPKRAASTSPVRAGSEAAYWSAILFEAKPAKKPATLYAVAKHLCDTGALPNNRASLDTAKVTVREWQKLPHYQSNVWLYRLLLGC